jgi:hypothetical protein
MLPEHLPREIAFHGVLMPTVGALFLLAMLLTWGLDRLLAELGVYRHVWHPILLRMSLFAGVFAGLALTVHP